jgi:nucleoside-diphosphate-sugar epimerase
VKNVVLTGASGFVGTALMDLLRRQHLNVLTISKRELDMLGASKGQGSQLYEALYKFKPDTLIHLAWNVEATNWTFAKSQQSLIDSTSFLLDFLAKCGIMQSIGIGSCLEYIPVAIPLDEYCAENSELEYMRNKLEMKHLLLNHAAQNSYIATWARFFFLYGSNDRIERLIPSTAKKLLSNRDVIVENPSARIDYLNVKDAVDAIFILAQTRSGGVFNVGSGVQVTPIEIVQKMSNLISSNSKIISIPKDNHSIGGLVANPSKLKDLGWSQKISLDQGLRHILSEFQVEI